MSHAFKPELEGLVGGLEGLEGPGVEPGATSGESIKVRRECETRTEQGKEFPPPAAYDLLKFHKFSFWNVL